MTAMKRRTFLQAAGYTTLYASLAADFAKSAAALTPKEIASDDPDLHFLRRASFGPVAQELAKLRSMGRAAYLEEQFTRVDGVTDAAVTALYPLIASPPLAIYSGTGAGFFIDQHILEYQSAMIYRGLFSTAQLHEVMVDFWNDHFNTYVRKNPIPLKLAWDREVIRPNALGNFKTLLRASVRHGEMLFYLDNWMNRLEAINENYARELLELHTLGKDGGYTEADMKALSFILSGLMFYGDPLGDGLNAINYGQAFFAPQLHDTREKNFLGQHFPAGGGEEEIDFALNLILNHPGTARHIATKLCKRFVADDPPGSIVDRVASEFTRTGGDIPAMLRVLFGSSEFDASAGQKVKRPANAMIGAARVCGVNHFDYFLNTEIYGTLLGGDGLLFQSLTAAGQQPFNWVPPNGYPDSKAYWANTNSLLYQQKFLVRLAETLSYSRLLADPVAFLTQGGSTASQIAHATTPRAAVNNCIANILFTKLPDAATAAAVAFVAQDADPDAPMETGVLEQRIQGLVFVLMSSPWFLLR